MGDIDKAVDLARTVVAEVYDGAYVGAVGDGPVLARAVLAMAAVVDRARKQAHAANLSVEARRVHDERPMGQRTLNARARAKCDWLDATTHTEAAVRDMDLDAEARRG